MAGTAVEAAYHAWDDHLAQHGCTSLACAVAQARWLAYLAALREPRDNPGQRDRFNPRPAG
jgi:hypothetical protein